MPFTRNVPEVEVKVMLEELNTRPFFKLSQIGDGSCSSLVLV